MTPRYGTLRVSTMAVLDGNQQHRRLLYVFTYLATLTSLQILYLALDDLKLLAGLTGAVTAGFVYSYYVGPRFRAVTTYAVSLLAVGLSIYYAIQIQAKFAMYGNYLGVLLGILTALLAYKAFSPNDHRFILMVCVVFLLFSSVASYDLKFMLLLPLFLVFAGISLYIANQVEVAVRVAGTTGRQVKVRFNVGWGFLAVLARATIGVIVLSIVAYIITPHSTQENRNLMLGSAPEVDEPATDSSVPEDRGQTTADGEAQIGIGDDFDLTDSRRLTSVGTPVLQVKSHRAGYLRAQVYDIYTGSGWIKSPPLDDKSGTDEYLHSLKRGELTNQPQAYEINYVPLFDFPSRSYAEYLKSKHSVTLPEDNRFSPTDVYEIDPANMSYDIIRQEIKLLADQPAYYFAMYQPFRLENISKATGNRDYDIPLVDGASLLRPASMAKIHPENFTYTVYSLEPRPKPAQLDEVYSKGPREVVEHYTQLPREAGYDPAVHGRLGIERDEYRPISRQLINFSGRFALPAPAETEQGPLSVYDKVLAIYQHLLDAEEEYTYSREFVPIDSSAELTEAFVMGTRSGYCRYFASAMAVLCRINDIPARVVTGYSPGTFSLIDNAYIVRASNAHAWVEVYIDGYGWLMFDPSPGSTAGPAGAESRQMLSGVIDFLQNLFIIDPAGTQQLILGLVRDLWDRLVAHWLLSILALAVLTGLIAVALLLRRSTGRLRRRPFIPENTVIAAYLSLGDELGRLGHLVVPGITARSYLTAVAAEHQPIHEPLTNFVPVYEQAAFSPRELDDASLQAAWEVSERVKLYVREEIQRRKRTR